METIREKTILFTSALFWIVIIIGGFWWLLYCVSLNDDKLNKYSECIYTHARADGFKGTDKDAWIAYESVCASGL